MEADDFEGAVSVEADMIGEKSKDCGVRRLVPEATDEMLQEVQEIVDSLPPRA